MQRKIVFIGGDKRQVYAALKLIKEGYSVYLAGFDKLDADIPKIENYYEADIFVLPLTGVKDNVVPAYYSDKELKIEPDKLNDKLVFMGKADTLNASGSTVYNLLKREDFAEANALPSAEGAISVAMQSYEESVEGSSCLVIGYGRIGKALSRKLRDLGAKVSVATRSAEKAKSVKSDKNTPISTSELRSLNGFDIVFNTADALVLGADILRNSDNSTLIIDLASLPGGVDFDSAESFGFKTIHALGLPGKFSPKAAGKIISDTILRILKEE